MIDTINATGKVMVIYPLVLPVPPPLKGVGGTRALAHSIKNDAPSTHTGPHRGMEKLDSTGHQSTGFLSGA